MTETKNSPNSKWLMIATGALIGATIMFLMHYTCLLPKSTYAKCYSYPVDSMADEDASTGTAHMLCAACGDTMPNNALWGLQVPVTDTAAYVLAFRDNVKMVDATTPITIGGRIHRCVLEAVLSSLPADENYMNYRFGYDMDHKKIILLAMGGASPTGEPVIYRTGTAPECWCPNFCH